MSLLIWFLYLSDGLDASVETISITYLVTAYSLVAIGFDMDKKLTCPTQPTSHFDTLNNSAFTNLPSAQVSLAPSQ